MNAAEPFALALCEPTKPTHTPRCTRPAWKKGRITLVNVYGKLEWVCIVSVSPGRNYIGLVISEENEGLEGKRVAFTHSDIVKFKKTRTEAAAGQVQ